MAEWSWNGSEAIIADPEIDGYSAESMRERETLEREAGFRGEFNAASDFGAYAALARRGDPSALAAHALAVEEDARLYVAQLSRFLRTRGLALGGTVIDAGSAIGTITEALRQAGATRAIGIEISRDGVELAGKTYPRCEFLCRSVDELDDIPDGSVSAIHGREFYPFTRTQDMKKHRRYLGLFARKLKPGGFVVLCMKRQGGLADTFPAIVREACELGFTRAESDVEPPLGFARRLGRAMDLSPLRALACAASAALGRPTAVWHLFLK